MSGFKTPDGVHVGQDHLVDTQPTNPLFDVHVHTRLGNFVMLGHVDQRTIDGWLANRLIVYVTDDNRKLVYPWHAISHIECRPEVGL
jgi:hypothetical protein